MVESAPWQTDVSPETAIPTASLESIVRTEELVKRPARPPDYERETGALAALVRALAESPDTILQTLADKVLEVLRAESAGLSLLTKDEDRFYWAAIAGAWHPHIGGGTPRGFGPCGDVLDRNVPMLFSRWDRRYPYLAEALPLANEGLLVPFYVKGRPVGTIWAIAHNESRKFDREDLRLLESLGQFASAAYQAVESIESLKLEVAAREQAELGLRQLTGSLEAQVRARTAALSEARAELAQAARLATVAQLSAAIAHEVNQPLGAVAANAAACQRWLSAATPDLERARLSAERTVRDANLAFEVVNRVRALFKQAEPAARAVDLNQVIEQVRLLILQEMSGRGVRIETDLQRDLPVIPADRVQIREVLVNLVRNGIEAMEAMTEAPRLLMIRSRREGSGYVRVEVCDSGCGLQDPESVFKPFFTTKKTGMGMGLSICRTIVEAHEGRISVRPNEGAGATFTVELPLVLQGSATCADQALGMAPGTANS
ncbi:MAG TPA: ATP-binding protein [Burkholderiales bacterium]|nr:ATP-binding protein [Burkholderiales bacterium]